MTDSEREPTLYVTDAEIIRRMGVPKLTHAARRRAREKEQELLRTVRAEIEERCQHRPWFLTKEQAMDRLKISPAHWDLLVERKIFPDGCERWRKIVWDMKLLEPTLGRLGTVYFVSMLEFIKIGFTARLADRMRAFETIHPIPVTLLHSIAGNIALEQYLHSKFAEFLVSRKKEWFRSDSALLAYIAELRRPA
jgi:T5orf172 domain